MAMKVVYDITVLGSGFFNNSTRAGIFRVVETVARKLLASDDCTLSFSACSSVTDVRLAAKYRAHDPEFRQVPFRVAGGARARRTLALLTAVTKNPEKYRKSWEWLTALFLVPVRFFAKRSGFIRPGIDAEMFADADIYHSTFFPLPDRSGMPPHLKRVITVYDLIPIFHPEFFGGNKNHILHDVVRSITPDDYVLAISEATKKDLCDYAGIDPHKVFVTPLAADDSFYLCTDDTKLRSVRKKYGIPEVPYILSLSTLEPRKNIAQTIRCFSRFVMESGVSDLNLVLVGAKGWDYSGIFDELNAHDSVRERIILPGYVADEDLAAVYSGALMFVYPSFYEGFGLPPLEAMQCGVPVITSNSSSLPEVVGDAGIMVDPTDADALCRALSELYFSDEKRRELGRKSLERAREFSWTKCVDITLAAYRAALSS